MIYNINNIEIIIHCINDILLIHTLINQKFILQLLKMKYIVTSIDLRIRLSFTIIL